jgi:hypothetical protein
MRAFDRDLIRGGHYGQRPGVPHSKAEHMAAPTNAADAKKTLANQEPSTHGPTRTSGDVRSTSAKGCKADLLCSSRAFPVLTDTVEKVADEVGKSLNLDF